MGPELGGVGIAYFWRAGISRILVHGCSTVNGLLVVVQGWLIFLNSWLGFHFKLVTLSFATQHGGYFYSASSTC